MGCCASTCVFHFRLFAVPFRLLFVLTRFLLIAVRCSAQYCCYWFCVWRQRRNADRSAVFRVATASPRCSVLALEQKTQNKDSGRSDINVVSSTHDYNVLPPSLESSTTPWGIKQRFPLWNGSPSTLFAFHPCRPMVIYWNGGFSTSWKQANSWRKGLVTIALRPDAMSFSGSQRIGKTTQREVTELPSRCGLRADAFLDGSSPFCSQLRAAPSRNTLMPAKPQPCKRLFVCINVAVCRV